MPDTRKRISPLNVFGVNAAPVRGKTRRTNGLSVPFITVIQYSYVGVLMRLNTYEITLRSFLTLSLSLLKIHSFLLRNLKREPKKKKKLPISGCKTIGDEFVRE